MRNLWIPIQLNALALAFLLLPSISNAQAGGDCVVGGTVRAILEERDFPVGDLRLLASARSAGRATRWRFSATCIFPIPPRPIMPIRIRFPAGSVSA